MAKMKEFLMDILEQYQNGATIKTISDNTGLPMDVVFNILQDYSNLVEEDAELPTLQ